MQATIVFEKNWNAINEILPNGKRKYRYIINTGSSRSSKTHSLLQTHYLRAWANPGSRISIWRDTKKDTKDTVLADFKKIFPSLPNNQLVTFNKTESIYLLPNGSTIEICGSDDETKVHGFQGDVLHFNEPYKMSKETFDQLDMRNSDYVVIDWNPKANHWIDSLSKQDNALVINSTWRDNPFVPEEQKNKIKSYKPISYAYCVKEGLIDKEQALKYDVSLNELKLTNRNLKDLINCQNNEKYDTSSEHNYLVYSEGLKAEKPNKIYKGWERMRLNEFLALPYPSYYGLDFGLTNATALCEVKYNDGTFYLNERLYKPEREMQQGLVHELTRTGIDKKTVMMCDSASPDKIRELRTGGFYAMPAKKGAGSVFSGISFMQRANFKYTDTSTNIEFEYDNYSWDSDRMGIIDKPIMADDHALDCIRYIVSYLQKKYRIVI